MIHGWWYVSWRSCSHANTAEPHRWEGTSGGSKPTSCSKQDAQGSAQQVLDPNITDVTPSLGSVHSNFFLFYPGKISHVPTCACCPRAPLRKVWSVLQLCPPQGLTGFAPGPCAGTGTPSTQRQGSAFAAWAHCWLLGTPLSPWAPRCCWRAQADPTVTTNSQTPVAQTVFPQCHHSLLQSLWPPGFQDCPLVIHKFSVPFCLSQSSLMTIPASSWHGIPHTALKEKQQQDLSGLKCLSQSRWIWTSWEQQASEQLKPSDATATCREGELFWSYSPFEI